METSNRLCRSLYDMFCREARAERMSKAFPSLLSGFKPATYCWVDNRGSVVGEGIGGVGLEGRR